MSSSSSSSSSSNPVSSSSSSSSGSPCPPLNPPETIRFILAEIDESTCNAECTFRLKPGGEYPPVYLIDTSSNVNPATTTVLPVIDSNGCVIGWKISIQPNQSSPCSSLVPLVLVQEANDPSPVGNYVVPDGEEYTGSGECTVN